MKVVNDTSGRAKVDGKHECSCTHMSRYRSAESDDRRLLKSILSLP